MFLIDEIAEARITEAIERGDLSGLSCEGKRLDVKIDPLIPEELRMAYRILKNSGFLPEELRLRREISDINDLLRTLPQGTGRARVAKRLNLLRARLSLARRKEADTLLSDERYFATLCKRLERS